MSNCDPHQERRNEVSLLVANMIAEVGLNNVTIRSIANRSGLSTRSITYYFPDKQKMLVQVYRDAGGRLRERIMQVLDADPLDLPGLLEALLPTDDDAKREWSVNFAFWDMAVSDPELRTIQRNSVNRNLDRISSIMQARKEAGLTTLTSQDEARRLLLIVQGIAVQSLFDPEYWTPQRQRDFLTSELERSA